jgi:hypothetical protein
VTLIKIRMCEKFWWRSLIHQDNLLSCYKFLTCRKTDRHIDMTEITRIFLQILSCAPTNNIILIRSNFALNVCTCVFICMLVSACMSICTGTVRLSAQSNLNRRYFAYIPTSFPDRWVRQGQMIFLNLYFSSWEKHAGRGATGRHPQEGQGHRPPNQVSILIRTSDLSFRCCVWQSREYPT